MANKSSTSKQATTSPSDTDSDDESNTDSSASPSPGPTRRKISGQQSDSTDTSEEEEVDVKDQYLLPCFKPKPTKVEVSAWAKRTLRGPFLGTPIGSDERAQLIDDYYCSEADYKLFSAPSVTDSPLDLLVNGKSSALNDLTKIHSDLLFAMRVGLISYEKILDLAAAWADEQKSDLGKVTVPAGIWNKLSYRFVKNLTAPVAFKIRDQVPGKDVEALLKRDFVASAADDTERLEILARYALSYMEAFNQLQELSRQAHEDAVKLDNAVSQIKVAAKTLTKDTGSSLRLLGGVCQQIKIMREREYVKPLDNKFKKFLAQKKKGRSQEEKRDNRANALVDEDLAGQAKRYGKLVKVMEGVTSEKKKKFRKTSKAAAGKSEETKTTRNKKGGFQGKRKADNKSKKPVPKKKPKKVKDKKDKDKSE